MDDLVIQGDVQFNRQTHEYFHLPTKKKLTSVSQVIKIVYAKKSWDGVDEAIIENARARGTAVDDYVAEYIRTGRVSMPAGEREDVIERVTIAVDLLEKHYGQRRKAEAQKIVYDADRGVAGCADIVIDDEEVVDLKATYQPEADWMLQIGGYAWLGKYSKSAILHVSPKFYKKEQCGGKLLRYSTTSAAFWFHDALQWFEKTKELEREFKERKGIQPEKVGAQRLL